MMAIRSSAFFVFNENLYFCLLQKLSSSFNIYGIENDFEAENFGTFPWVGFLERRGPGVLFCERRPLWVLFP